MDNGHFALKSVVAFFCLAGALSFIEMALAVAQGNISLNFGVLVLFVGIGLLRHRRAWQIAALVCACLTAVASSAFGVFLLVSGQSIAYSGWGRAGTLPHSAGLAFAVLGLAVGLWQFWVLTRPRVKQLFQLAAA